MRPAKRWGLIGSGLVAPMALLFACSSKSTPGFAPVVDAGDPTTTIRIGASLGLSGGLRGSAQNLQSALTVAAYQINASGGILGKQLVFDVEDDQLVASFDAGSPLNAAFGKFFGQTNPPIAAILGPQSSDQVLAAYPAAKANHFLEISPTATAVEFSGLDASSVFAGQDRYFFRTVPSDLYQARTIAQFAHDGPVGGDGGARQSCGTMAILAIDNAYGHQMADLVKQRFTGADGSAFSGTVSTTIYFPTTAATFTDPGATFSAVVASKSDCQVVIGYEDTVCTYFKTMAARRAELPQGGATFLTITTDGTYNNGLFDACRSTASDGTSTSYADGVYGTIADTAPDTDAYKQFAQIYASVYPGTTAASIYSYASNMFDAAVLTALAIQSAGGIADRVRLRDSLVAVSKAGTKYTPNQLSQALIDAKNGVDIDYQGASGDVDLDETTGDVTAPYIVWRVDQTSGAAPHFTTVQNIPFAEIAK